jgi:hypothetical protein
MLSDASILPAVSRFEMRRRVSRRDPRIEAVLRKLVYIGTVLQNFCSLEISTHIRCTQIFPVPAPPSSSRQISTLVTFAAQHARAVTRNHSCRVHQLRFSFPLDCNCEPSIWYQACYTTVYVTTPPHPSILPPRSPLYYRLPTSVASLCNDVANRRSRPPRERLVVLIVAALFACDPYTCNTALRRGTGLNVRVAWR